MEGAASFHVTGAELTPDLAMAAQFLGYYHVTPTDEIQSLIRETCTALSPLLHPMARTYACPVSVGEGCLSFPFGEIKSKNLSHHMKGCTTAVFMGATVGAQVDRYITNASAKSPLSAAIAQAVGAMYIEVLCDLLNEKINTSLQEEGLLPRHRFSPGYGDFSLSYQPLFFSLLGLSQYAGMTLMSSGIMAPSKSVTALIGAAKP